MAGRLTAEIDTNVSGFLQQFSQGLNPVLDFAAQQAKLYLRNVALPEAVAIIAADAGEGFPRAYRNHLIVAMHRVPILVEHLGEGVFEIALDLSVLGDHEGLMLGAHHNAMLAENDDGDFKSFRITTKSQIKKVSLPYNGDELLNDEERRLEWWNDAIVGRRTPYTMVGANWNWTKPAIRTQDDAWIAENVPTFEQVASDRVNEAWEPLGMAPEWTILEWGTPAGSEPSVSPQNFRFRLQELMSCVCNEAIQSAIVAFERLLSERQVVGVKGPQAAPYNTLGQFVNYKDLLATSVPNLSKCLALI